MNPYRIVFVLSFLLVRSVFAECPYPCFTEVPSSAFAQEQYDYASPNTFEGITYWTLMQQPWPVPARTPHTPPLAPFQWSLQYPYASPFAGEPDDSGCTNTDPFIDGLGNSLPMTLIQAGVPPGLIMRYNAAYFYRSSPVTGVRGLGLHAAFKGEGPVTDGQNGLWQAAFFHSQRCYGGSTEFGFRRIVNEHSFGFAQSVVQFYFMINANCLGNCTVTGPSGPYILHELTYEGDLSIPTVENSRGGDDWLYLAWLNRTGTSWTFEVLDPYTKSAPANTPNYMIHIAVPENYPGTPDAPAGIFQKYTRFMLPSNPGLSGYVSMTAELGSGWIAPPDPVTDQAMNVAHIYTATYECCLGPRPR